MCSRFGFLLENLFGSLAYRPEFGLYFSQQLPMEHFSIPLHVKPVSSPQFGRRVGSGRGRLREGARGGGECDFSVCWLESRIFWDRKLLLIAKASGKTQKKSYWLHSVIRPISWILMEPVELRASI